jgi:nitrate reductase gamma subunit
MGSVHILAFVVFPYIALTTFVVGHVYRYCTDPLGWTARSSEFLEREGAWLGITLFHWGIIVTALGHAGGLLIPQRVYDAVGIDGEAHTRLAMTVGFVIGVAAFVGISLILWRRATKPRVTATTTFNNLMTLLFLLVAIGTGLYNVIFGHYYVLDTVAPWIRSIVLLNPEPELMVDVPLSYKLHIVSGLGVLGFSPFSRLIHIWSAPFVYLFRSYIVFRRL